MRKSIRLLCLALAMTLCVGITFAGEKLTLMPGAWSGNTIDFLRNQIADWEKETGVAVEILSVPNNGSEILAIAQQNLAAQNPDVDIYPMDIVWQGMLGRYFIDLQEHFPAEEIARYNPAAIEANMIGGRLVGIPFYGDISMFYYRTDLLEKYGFGGPPATWTELREMSEKIQEGERAAGNQNFWGFVFPGAVFEGFACDIVEWLAGNDAGTWVDKDGNVTADTPNVREILEIVTKFPGQISPPGVTSYMNDDARGFFQSGNAAFMRNWPFAYAMGQSPDSPIRDKFAVGPIPHGPKGESHSCLGGWQVAISRFSKNQARAAELIKFINRPDNQKERMLKLARTVTHMELLKDPEIVAAYPWTDMMMRLKVVARPAAYTGTKYNQMSSACQRAVHDMLTGKEQVGPRLERLQSELTRIKGRGW